MIIWQEICSVMVRRCILVTSNHYWWRGPSPQWRCNTSNNALREIILQEKQSSSTNTSNTTTNTNHKYWCIKRWGKYLQEKHSNNLQYIKCKKIYKDEDKCKHRCQAESFSASLGVGLTFFLSICSMNPSEVAGNLPFSYHLSTFSARTHGHESMLENRQIRQIKKCVSPQKHTKRRGKEGKW